MNGEFPLIIECYQTCSILILGRYICIPSSPTLYGSLVRGAPRQGLALGPTSTSCIRPLLRGSPWLGLALGSASARAGAAGVVAI